MAKSNLHHKILLISLCLLGSANGRFINIENKCKNTVWTGIYSGAGMAQPYDSGFVLKPKETYLFESRYKWVGRIWARTNCKFDANGNGKCATGDCHGQLKCKGWEGTPPYTHAVFSLDNPEDSYAVDVQHGYNIPVTVSPVGGIGECPTSSCVANKLKSKCPKQLQVTNSKGRVVGCKSACDFFQDAPSCCTWPNQGEDCKPTEYSKLFKSYCPTAMTYSEDPFMTCQKSNFTVTFC